MSSEADEFEEFFNSLYPRVVALFAARETDIAAAVDVGREAFARVYAEWERLDLPRPWAAKAAFDLLESRESPAEADATPWSWPGFAELPEPLLALLRGTADLPPRLRTVAELHYLLGLDPDEIVPVLGKPESSVAFHVDQARQRLEKQALGVGVSSADGPLDIDGVMGEAAEAVDGVIRAHVDVDKALARVMSASGVSSPPPPAGTLATASPAVGRTGAGVAAAAGAEPVGTGVGVSPTSSSSELFRDAEHTLTEALGRAREEADRLLATARAEADQILAAARREADAMSRRAADAHQVEVGSLTEERAALQDQVDNLRAFEREYHSRLRAFVETHLEQLVGGHERKPVERGAEEQASAERPALSPPAGEAPTEGKGKSQSEGRRGKDRSAGPSEADAPARSPKAPKPGEPTEPTESTDAPGNKRAR